MGPGGSSDSVADCGDSNETVELSSKIVDAIEVERLLLSVIEDDSMMVYRLLGTDGAVRSKLVVPEAAVGSELTIIEAEELAIEGVEALCSEGCSLVLDCEIVSREVSEELELDNDDVITAVDEAFSLVDNIVLMPPENEDTLVFERVGLVSLDDEEVLMSEDVELLFRRRSVEEPGDVAKDTNADVVNGRKFELRALEESMVLDNNVVMLKGEEKVVLETELKDMELDVGVSTGAGSDEADDLTTPDSTKIWGPGVEKGIEDEDSADDSSVEDTEEVESEIKELRYELVEELFGWRVRISDCDDVDKSEIGSDSLLDDTRELSDVSDSSD